MITRSGDIMNETEKKVFSDYACYYDLLYRDKDYSAESAYLKSLILKYNSKASSILDLGCGTGIHASIMASKGFRVHGVERSPSMLARCAEYSERKGIDPVDNILKYTKGDIRYVHLNEYFDVVTALFHVMSYQITNNDIDAAFNTALSHLNAGGIFIFDIWYGPAVYAERPSVRVKRVSDECTYITRISEPVHYPDENKVDVNYNVIVRNQENNEMIEFKEQHSMRYFSRPEIEYISENHGLKVVDISEWLTGNNISEDTFSVCVVAKKV